MKLTIFSAVALVAVASSALAQSDSALAPDGGFALVQKNLGTQRWAIVRDQQERTVTGNVFNVDGSAQFIWCRNLAGNTYECVGNDGCSQSPCAWAPVATVDIPESFFALRGDPVQTPRPTSVPTPRPTNPPQSGLQGLIGTWDLTFRVISTFTFRYRLQQVQAGTGGYPILVGRNVLGDAVVVGRIQEIDPGNGLPYEYALAEQTVGVCYLYVFDQTGPDRVAGLQASAFQLSNGDCGTFLGDNAMTGARVSSTASVNSAESDAEPAVVKRAHGRQARALRAETRDAKAAENLEAGALFRALSAAAQE